MIAKETFTFLSELKENNNRDWFLANKKAYEAAKENFIAYVGALITEVAKFDPSVAGLNPKKCLFRINRDVRFSKDKSPYKINLSAVLGSEGKNTPGPCYYLHLQPGSCFAAGGYWMPNPEHLKAIRQEIDYQSEAFRKLVEAPAFKENFGSFNEEDKLKTAPKEYSKDHPDIEFLKLKSFTVSRKLPDKLFAGQDGVKEVAKTFEALLPIKTFLEAAVDL